MGSVPQGQGHETAAAQVVADALGITPDLVNVRPGFDTAHNAYTGHTGTYARSEEHTSELQSRLHLVCRLLLEKKKTITVRRLHVLAPYHGLGRCFPYITAYFSHTIVVHM